MSTKILETSDLHFEEEYEEFREETLKKLKKLEPEAERLWLLGDVGEQKDWNRLEDKFEDYRVRYVLGNMDTKEGQHYYADKETVEDIEPEEDPKLAGSGIKTENKTDFVQNIELFEEEITGNNYNVMFSHNPRHVGIDPWKDEFIPDDENSRGIATADHPFYDVIVTAHYHNGGAYVNENGALVIKSPSPQENYKQGAPDQTSQVIELSGDYVNIAEYDLETLDQEEPETVYDKTFRYRDGEFEEIDVEEYLE